MSDTGDPYAEDDDLVPVLARAEKRKEELAVLDPGLPEDGDDFDTELAFYPLNDFGNANRLKKRFGDDMMHVPEIGWHVWNSVCWDRKRGKNEAIKLGFRVAEAIRGEASAIKVRYPKGRDGLVKALFKGAVKTGNINNVRSMLASAEPYMSVQADELDVHDFLLATQSGTVELGTESRMRESKREDRITKSVSVGWNTKAVCPRWEQFLIEIMPDVDMRLFLQRIAGLILTGSVRDNGFFIFWGSGDNGKSTFVNVLRHILADYAAVTPIATFLEKRDGFGGGGASPDMARLPGARLVTASEPKQGARLDEGMIKDITGGDRQVARHLNQGFFEFNPRCKVIVPTNHKPVIRGTEHAIWKRIKLVPFTVQVQQVDRTLYDKLIAEAEGILQWMITGCEDWFANGLNPPPAALLALEEYRSDQDSVGEFLKTRCAIMPPPADPKERPFEEHAKDLRKAYLAWCEGEGIDKPMSSKAFGESLVSHGLPRRKTGGLMVYSGVYLLRPDEL